MSTVRLEKSVDQQRFNLECWKRVEEDPALVELPYRIETDRHGNLVMAPASPSHADYQGAIIELLANRKSNGRIVGEMPISTSEGVKVIDAGWMGPQRQEERKARQPLAVAPELCIEIFSPSNTHEEIANKARLYFEAGAEEFWSCLEDGQIQFFEQSGVLMQASRLFPDFPAQVS